MTTDNKKLEAFIDEGIRLSRRAGYHPTAFVEMRQRYDTIPAIAKLVVSGELQSGFRRMRELNLLEWSVEMAVVKFPELFKAYPGALECAQFRLKLLEDR